MTGAMLTPTRMPAAASRSTIWSRLRGVATPGSMARARSWSWKGRLMATLSLASRASCWSTSTSRSTIGDLVMMPTGFRKSAQTSRQPRVSRSDASSGW
jgi:hypothetical protein